ncbi:hypothetical protein, partial [Rhizobium leguminosarum]|uniref:hypothetical protein n=1 Tax=Rhizobium leguminosarum TaxID=384 RepID=UPI0019535432
GRALRAGDIDEDAVRVGGEEGVDVGHGWMADGFGGVSPPSVLLNQQTSRTRSHLYTRFIRSTAISTRSGVAGASSLGQTL